MHFLLKYEQGVFILSVYCFLHYKNILPGIIVLGDAIIQRDIIKGNLHFQGHIIICLTQTIFFSVHRSVFVVFLSNLL